MSPVGRPEIGTPVNVRLGADLLTRVDAAAAGWATSRAETIRRLLDYALTQRVRPMETMGNKEKR